MQFRKLKKSLVKTTHVHKILKNSTLYLLCFSKVLIYKKLSYLTTILFIYFHQFTKMKCTKPLLGSLSVGQFFVKPSLQNGFNPEFILIMNLQKGFQLIVKTPNPRESRVKSNYFEPTCKKNMGSAPNLRCIENHTIEGTYSENTSNH